jgi:hypothetical protein
VAWQMIGGRRTLKETERRSFRATAGSPIGGCGSLPTAGRCHRRGSVEWRKGLGKSKGVKENRLDVQPVAHDEQSDARMEFLGVWVRGANAASGGDRRDGSVQGIEEGPLLQKTVKRKRVAEAGLTMFKGAGGSGRGTTRRRRGLHAVFSGETVRKQEC